MTPMGMVSSRRRIVLLLALSMLPVLAQASAVVGALKDVPGTGNPDHSPAYWLKGSAESDGTFTGTNAGNGFSKTYRKRS